MKFVPKDPPRQFSVGNASKFDISDCGSMTLQPEEQITFLTDTGREFDVTRKEWGYYATPSLNGRLAQFGLRGVLVRNPATGRYFVLLVEEDRESGFQEYIDSEGLDIVCWLDTTEALDRVRSVTSSLKR